MCWIMRERNGSAHKIKIQLIVVWLCCIGVQHLLLFFFVLSSIGCLLSIITENWIVIFLFSSYSIIHSWNCGEYLKKSLCNNRKWRSKWQCVHDDDDDISFYTLWFDNHNNKLWRLLFSISSTKFFHFFSLFMWMCNMHTSRMADQNRIYS